MMLYLCIATIGVLLWFEWVNGAADSGNAIATVVVTEALPRRIAILLAVCMNMVGAFSGTAVAEMVGKGLIDRTFITLPSLFLATCIVIWWGLRAMKHGYPISKSHAMFAGLGGVALADGGFDALIMSGWVYIFVGLVLSIIGSVVIGNLLGNLTNRCVNHSSMSIRKTDKLFRALQLVSASVMAFSHGLNDAQKTMGLLMIVLIMSGEVPHDTPVLWWVIVLCAVVMGIGTACANMKTIHTIGDELGPVNPQQGFVAELVAGSVIMFFSWLHTPVSTSVILTSSVAGTRCAERIADLDTLKFGEIMRAWVYTFLVVGGLTFVAEAVRLRIVDVFLW